VWLGALYLDVGAGGTHMFAFGTGITEHAEKHFSVVPRIRFNPCLETVYAAQKGNKTGS